MKRTLIPLLLTAMLLAGCAAQNPQTEPTLAPPAPTVPAEPVQEAAIISGSRQDGALHTYHLTAPLQGILARGQELLLFSGTEEISTISLLDTASMTVTASHEPGFLLLPENATFQQLSAGLSYFNGSSRETVILDDALQQIRRIPAPENLVGFPLLSGDGRSLFYCTADAIRALDLDSGISRVLKESSYPVQGLSGLLLEDTVLQVSITDSSGQWSTLFLSSETGQLLRQCSDNLIPETGTSHFFLNGPVQGIDTILFGRPGADVQILNPLHADLGAFFLPESDRVVSAGTAGDHNLLEVYDLESGLRQAELVLPASLYLQTAEETADGQLWFLCYDTQALYRWNPVHSCVTDPAAYAGSYYTREAPDYDGLAACSLLAQELSVKYGIDILVYRDAAAVEPWDYHLDYEYRADVLLRELNALDARLGSFPAGFLDTLAGKFTGFHICLVRSAEGSPESGSLEAVNGIQFMMDFDAYIVLSTSYDTEYTLYHELSHLMETVVLTNSTAYDRWELLNPEGFQYDNDVIANMGRDGSAWLKPGAEYFIDAYSMSFAKEDRARLFEFAMTDGHEALFASPNLQRKLRQMCTGIREAFDLEKAPEPFLWEQYLLQPLV